MKKIGKLQMISILMIRTKFKIMRNKTEKSLSL